MTNTDYLDKHGREGIGKMYFMMNEIRFFEENINQMYQSNLCYGGMHLGVGEEACAVGSIFPLHEDDKIVTYHRGHGHSIAKGASVKKMVAELMARDDGLCRGRGGSIHILDMSCGQLGAQGIVGAQCTVAVGAAISARLRKLPHVTLCLFGDGAANSAQFHEGVNMAAIMNLPVVYVCVNNGYAVTFSAEKSIKAKSVADRAIGYGIEGFQVDGNDVFAVYDAVEKAVSKARDGGGPTLIDLTTYRWYGHYVGDPCNYRTREEEAHWKENNDPIKRLRSYILDNNVFSESELLEMEREAQAIIDEANEFAMASPPPKIEDMYSDLFYVHNDCEVDR